MVAPTTDSLHSGVDDDCSDATPDDDLDGDGYPLAEDCDDNDESLIGVTEDPECDGFYLHTNGITVLCPGAAVEDAGVVGKAAYTKWSCPVSV